MIASLCILVGGMASVGWWVGRQIENGVVHRSAATTALYVDSIVAPSLQDLAHSNVLAPESVQDLDRLFRGTPLGQQIGAFKIWDMNGRILYSVDPELIGQQFPVEGGLAQAFGGSVAARISNLDQEENVRERKDDRQLLEVYSPVRLIGTNQVIAVAEFYERIDDLQHEVRSAQFQSWLAVGLATLVMYLLLSVFVGRASDTIKRQQVALNEQITRLTDLLTQNEELHERVRRAAARTTALNERFLRRISAELHDGPVQDLALALLQSDHGSIDGDQIGAQRETTSVGVHESLSHALQEIRAISAGLGLPQLNELTLATTVQRVIRAHERRTHTKVALVLDSLPDQVPLPVKITLYRLVQEALTNAYRHAGGAGQQVRVSYDGTHLEIRVSDEGPGFDITENGEWDEHLGIVGMRERVESLGGSFRVESMPGHGTTVIARLSPQPLEEIYG
jgi:signal transduction histidine kinase